MTTIIYERYGTNLYGVKKYAINRFLRIYPTYLIVLTFSLCAIALIGISKTQAIDPNLSLPSTVKGWLMNISLIGLDFNVKERTIPQSWTLFIEIFFYAVIPLAVRLGSKFIIFWLLLSISYHVYFLFISNDPGFDWDARYGDVFAGSLGFSIGCAARFLLHKKINVKYSLGISITGLTLVYSTITYLMLTGYNQTDWKYISTFGFYLTMLLSLLFITNVMDLSQSKTNKFLGDLSYPLYLSHIPIGFVTISLLELQPKTLSSFMISLIFSIIGSIALYFIDKKINKIRDKIRPKITGL